MLEPAADFGGAAGETEIRPTWPRAAERELLLRDYELTLVSAGPANGAWRGNYMRCPLCHDYVSKGAGVDECRCGNLFVDGDAFRVAARDSAESEIECYDARPRRPT